MAEVQRQLAICTDRVDIIASQEAQLEENLQRMTTEEKEELRAFESRLTARDRTIEQMSAELEGLRSLVSLQQFSSDLDKPKPFAYQSTNTSHGRSSSLLEQSSHVVNLQPIKLEQRTKASPKQPSFRGIYGGEQVDITPITRNLQFRNTQQSSLFDFSAFNQTGKDSLILVEADEHQYTSRTTFNSGEGERPSSMLQQRHAFESTANTYAPKPELSKLKPRRRTGLTPKRLANKENM